MRLAECHVSLWASTQTTGISQPCLVAGTFHATGKEGSASGYQASAGNTSRRECGSGHGGSVPNSGTVWTVAGAGLRPKGSNYRTRGRVAKDSTLGTVINFRKVRAWRLKSD